MYRIGSDREKLKSYPDRIFAKLLYRCSTSTQSLKHMHVDSYVISTFSSLDDKVSIYKNPIP